MEYSCPVSRTLVTECSCDDRQCDRNRVSATLVRLLVIEADYSRFVGSAVREDRQAGEVMLKSQIRESIFTCSSVAKHGSTNQFL